MNNTLPGILQVLEQEKEHTVGTVLEKEYEEAIASLKSMINDLNVYNESLVSCCEAHTELSDVNKRFYQEVRRTTDFIVREIGEDVPYMGNLNDNETVEEYRYSPSRLKFHCFSKQISISGHDMSIDGGMLGIGNVLISTQILRNVFPKYQLNVAGEELERKFRGVTFDLASHLPIMGTMISLIKTIAGVFTNQRIDSLKNVAESLTQIQLISSFHDLFDVVVKDALQSMNDVEASLNNAKIRAIKELGEFRATVAEYEQFNGWKIQE